MTPGPTPLTSTAALSRALLPAARTATPLTLLDLTAALMVVLSGTPDTAGFDWRRSAGGASLTFTGVNTLTGGGNSGDSLTGLDAVSTWTLGVSDSYVSSNRTLSFSALEHIQGRSMVDAFTR